jgi:hypothetical protein
VTFPLQLNEYRSLPAPSFPAPAMSRGELRLAVLFYFPLLVFGCALLRARAARRPAGTALLALLGLAFFRQALNRADEIHLVPATLVACILAPALLYELARGGRRVAAVAAATAALLAGADAYLVGPLQGLVRISAAGGPATPRYDLERARGISRIAEQEQAIRYVREHTTGADRIFVGNSRHDRLVMNDISFYFLAGRHAATRYHDLCPGVATTLPVQREIVSDLERHGVEYVVLSNAWHDYVEPNASGRSSGVTFLDDYIRSRFRPVAQFGRYLVARRAT